MRPSKPKLLLLAGILTVAAAGTRGAGGSESYLALLDRFEVGGPGAHAPGWFDEFDNGNPDGWTNMGAFGPIGTWREEPGTTFARLESPGHLSGAVFGVHWYRTTIFSYQNGQSYVSANRGSFQGTATFAAMLPRVNQFLWFYLAFHRSIDGKEYQEQVHVTITNYAPEIAHIVGLPGGLQVEQKRFLLDAVTWSIVQTSNYRTKSIIPPADLGKVVLSIQYMDDPINPRFIPSYSLTDPVSLVVPFPANPIPSNLHLAEIGWWSVTTGIIIPAVATDIKPGSCPNSLNVDNRGLLPVALLGSLDFDVTLIDPDSIQLLRTGGLPRSAAVRWSYEDVATLLENAEPRGCHGLGPDGYLDLVLKFDTQDVASSVGNAQDGEQIDLMVIGNLKPQFGATPVLGQDGIRIQSK